MKRFLVLLLVISIAIIPFGATFADQNNTERAEVESLQSSEPVLRTTQCPECLAGSILLVSTDATPWVETGKQRFCTHLYPKGVDEECKRTVTKTYRCTKCNYGYTRSTDEYKWVCNGHY